MIGVHPTDMPAAPGVMGQTTVMSSAVPAHAESAHLQGPRLAPAHPFGVARHPPASHAGHGTVQTFGPRDSLSYEMLWSEYLQPYPVQTLIYPSPYGAPSGMQSGFVPADAVVPRDWFGMARQHQSMEVRFTMPESGTPDDLTRKPSPRLVICGACKRYFKNNYLLGKHKRRIHNASKPKHTCPDCGKAYHLHEDLLAHKKSCMKVLCCACGFKARRQVTIKKHCQGAGHPEQSVSIRDEPRAIRNRFPVNASLLIGDDAAPTVSTD
mmetsp:Transcript_12686/g.42917  ORF Transcript_12686/g.42917 Transcript_12686/m.42917 type:complete len:267 (+) Transcript_12686:60-860(+)